MKYFFKNRDDHKIDAEIEALHKAMKDEGPEGEKYPKMIVWLERLHDIKAKTRRVRVSPDTIVLVAGNLLGIILIVAYEKKDIWTSKALSERIRPERHHS